MQKEYDLIIIGSGPAGFSCAMQAGTFKKRVLIIEENEQHFGGSWINSGTVPSKTLREAATVIFKYNRQIRPSYGHRLFERYSMANLLQFKSTVQENEKQHLKQNLINNNVETKRGHGRIKDAHTVEIRDPSGKSYQYSGKFILLATGSRPVQPSNFEIDHSIIFDIESLFNLDHIPHRLVIAGTGIQAVEFATTFAAMGTKVTLMNTENLYLNFMDDDIRTELDRVLNNLGVYVYSNSQIRDIYFNPVRNRTEIRFSSGKDNTLKVIETEHVLHISRRIASTQSLGLESVGIPSDRDGFIKVNQHYQTDIPSIYAAGDVIGFPSLASVSFTQGRVAACHMFQIPSHEIHDSIPYGIYTIPEISSIGLNENEAKHQGLQYSTGIEYFRNITRADVNNAGMGILKLIFETETLKLLGVHILGENACDLIHIGQAVITLGGTIEYFTNQVFNYPTFTEAYRNAAFNGLNQLSSNRS